MSYLHKEVSGVDLVELEESIDLYSAPPIKKFLRTLLKSENKKILISMERVSFIDSSGLGMLVNLFFECKQREIRIKLASVSAEARHIFKQTKMESNFEMFDTVNEAMASFG